jgi:hypothetical protein
VKFFKGKFVDLNFFVPIMKYMGDYPSKRARQATELTDAILEPALQHVSFNNINKCVFGSRQLLGDIPQCFQLMYILLLVVF